MLIDLHIHTTASDGVFSPRRLMELARDRGLAVVGIADHDTTNGIEEACRAGDSFGVTVVPAVEINSYSGDAELHILGYFIDHRNRELQKTLAHFRRARVSRMNVIISKLATLGIALAPEEVFAFAGKGAVGRPHIARALEEKGHVHSVRDAFNTLIGDGKPAYAPRSKLTPDEAISIIRRAGGAAVLAHPGLWRADSLIPRLVDSGLAGIEVFSTAHDTMQTRYYLELARSLELCATGGSDFHGWDNSRRRGLGSALTPPEEFERLKASCDS